MAGLALVFNLLIDPRPPNLGAESAACVDVSTTNRMNSSATLLMHTPSPLLSRDSGSAIFCFPGTYCTVNLYGWSLRTQRSILAEVRELVE